MAFYERITVLFILSLCWAGLCLHAQPAQLDFRQYNTDDGLPSSETYTILEDHSGYLWIGTDNGVARFDGYEFQVFDTDDGLEDMVVFGIVEDDDGVIWISTLSGKIYFFEGGKFHPFGHNHVIEKLKASRHLGVLIDVTSDKELILSFKNAGVLKISMSGDIEWILDATATHIYLYESSGGKDFIHVPPTHGFFHSLASRHSDSTGVFILNENSVRPLGQVKHPPVSKNYFLGRSYFSGIFSTSDGKKEAVFSNTRKVVILNEDGSLKHDYNVLSNRYNYFMAGFYPNTYWAFLKRGEGLEGHDFRGGRKTPQISRQLQSRSLSSGMIDANGGFWITTLDAGVFYCPYPKQQVYRKGDETKNDKAISIALTASDNFYAGYDDGSFYHYSKKTMGLRQIEEEGLVGKDRIFDLHYDSIRSLMLTSFYSFKHPVPEGSKLSKGSVNWFYDDTGHPFGVKYFNELKGKNSRKIFASSISGMGTLDLESDISVSFVTDVRALPGNAHVFGMHPDGRRLVGTLFGILVLREDGTLVPDNLGVPELSKRVVFIKDLGNDALLFGTRGDGVVYMGADTTYLIRESDGLASDMIRDIHVSKTGTIWLSTLNGLSRLDLSPDGNEYKVRTFRMEHGLPSTEVHQTDTYGDEIWLATSAGVVKYEEPPLIMDSPAPVIRSVVLNGDEVPDTTSYVFPPGSQDVSISFGTINFVLEDKVPYRYRINEASLWKYSRERTANYPNLGAGAYRFEVQSKNQDGVWSEGAIREFTIGTPWYATVWATIGGGLLLISALSGFFLLRERRKKREQELLFQITQLEHAALHAQMNPHFVFNALNSIQNFVLHNDAKQAATYLARFARVIRQTLRSSVDGRHHLGEELMMLETYLGLEKLRFKDGFSFTIEVDPLLPKDEIVLPPLLIQPFVENAIIHGLKDRKKGGQISVRFTGTTDNLVVVIEDNGKGYTLNDSNKPESLGMDITRRRLDMMNIDQNGASGMEVDPLFSDTGVLRGTRVTLFIRPLKAPLHLRPRPNKAS